MKTHSVNIEHGSMHKLHMYISKLKPKELHLSLVHENQLFSFYSFEIFKNIYNDQCEDEKAPNLCKIN